jgi:hypothetical protein
VPLQKRSFAQRRGCGVVPFRSRKSVEIFRAMDLDYDFDGYFEDEEDRLPDPKEEQAIAILRMYFEENKDRVFSSRQVQVEFENQFFHWIIHRALKALAEEGFIRSEQRTLSYGAPIGFVWHRSNRYNRRQIKEVQELVERYSNKYFTAALGNTAELLVSDGFSRFGFVQRGRETREYKGKKWIRTEHDLDFIFERDDRAYGVEVKNTLPYIDDKELYIKLALCEHIGVHPVFVVRALPRIWVQDIVRRGGFALILRHQLYPLSHKPFAEEVRTKLGLPVDAPRALYDGTMLRFVKWHETKLAE